MNQTAKRKARILVVDDDPALLRLLTIRLRADRTKSNRWRTACWHSPPRCDSVPIW